MSLHLFAEKILVPFIPVATVAGIGGSCLYIYSDEVFGPGAGYDIFIVAQSTTVSDSNASEELYKEVEATATDQVQKKSVGVFLQTDVPPPPPLPAQPQAPAQPPAATPKVEVPKKIRNYKCGLSISEKPVNESCYLTKKVDLSNTDKNWYNLSHIGIPEDYSYLIQSFDKPIIETPTEVQKDDLKVDKKYFVIQVTESLFNQIDWSESQTLDVYELNNKEAVFGKLKPIFAIYGDYVGVLTDYVLAKAEEITLVNPPAGGTSEKKETSHDLTTPIPSDNLCFRTYPIGASDNDKAVCTFYDFSGDTKHAGDNYWYKHAKFSGEYTASTKIEVDKYYLIKFDQKYYAKAIVDMSLYYSIPATSTSNEEKLIKFSSAIPVTPTEIDSKKHLFIYTKS